MQDDLLLTLLHRVNARARRARDEGSLPPGAGRLLSVLRRSEGVSQRELAENLNIRPQSLTDLVLQSETRGLIARRSDPADRRKYLLFLTPEGEAAEETLCVERHERAVRLFAPLDGEEKDALAALLTKLAEAPETNSQKETTV